MLSRMLMLVFGFIAVAHGTSVTNISEVLNTGERTWIYSTTWNKSKCVSYIKYDIQCLHGFCYYYYNYFRKGCKKSAPVRIAEIQQKCLVTGYRDKPCVVTRKSSPYYKEVDSKVLMHWDDNIGCGVYKVLPAPSRPKATRDPSELQKCELHVRDKALRHRRNNTLDLKPCEEALKKECGENHTSLTNYSCMCPNE
ncbi:uncharacterized protein [Dermacentor andersoni]|uniref:uncharacterized protein n=1 Tax=Dermacentor andersoni TaxID=34620 RepID=UPI002416EF4D|nr:uncharacterized protein LOC129380302 [Dermacentor andersoni]